MLKHLMVLHLLIKIKNLFNKLNFNYTKLLFSFKLDNLYALSLKVFFLTFRNLKKEIKQNLGLNSDNLWVLKIWENKKIKIFFNYELKCIYRILIKRMKHKFWRTNNTKFLFFSSFLNF